MSVEAAPAHNGGMNTDGDLIGWTESFMSDRRVRMVINGHQCEQTTVDTSVSQGLLVLPIIFSIYLSGVFQDVEK